MADSASGRGKVFVVEDEWVVAHDVANLLQDAGLDVVGVATSAEDALIRIRDVRVDLVVSDIRLGRGMDGITMARQLWDERGIPTVLLTAFGDAGTLSAAMAAGVVGYVVKPFDEIQLLSCVLVGLKVHARGSHRFDPAPLTVSPRWQAAVDLLSPREREVLRALVANRRVAHIAQELFISPYTVRNHLKAIFRKFGVSSQAELLSRLREDERRQP